VSEASVFAGPEFSIIVRIRCGCEDLRGFVRIYDILHNFLIIRYVIRIRVVAVDGGERGAEADIWEIMGQNSKKGWRL
jgi:hypothetical protein